jgi:ankyrin repeat protein
MPLCASTKRVGAEIARVLIEAGACVDSVDGKRWTAAHHAVAQGNVEMLEALVGAGADLEQRTGDDGLSVRERVEWVEDEDVKRGFLDVLGKTETRS